jgi:phospholipase C
VRRVILAVAFLTSLARGQSLKHIIIIVKENRSFDHYFGQFPGVTGGPITSYKCVGTTGGCSGGSLAVILADPNQADADCGHYYINSVVDYDGGLMDKFNHNCQGNTDWAKQYGATTIPFYWSMASTYGLADHMFASAMGPSYPNHLYIIAATSNEAQDNPAISPGRPPNGQGNNEWTCDAFHYGRCQSGANAPMGLCSVDSDCGNGYVTGSCVISQGTGTCSVGGESCTFDTDCSSGYCTNGDVYTAKSGAFYGIDLLGWTGSGGTGQQMYPGLCAVNRKVGCNAVCNGSAHHCDLASDCSIYSGAVNTFGTSVTWVSGNQFTSAMQGQIITINATQYTISSYNSPTSLTLGSSAGSQSNANYTAAQGACNINDPACTALGDVCDVGSRQFLSAARGSACPNVTTIADRLDSAGIAWGMYYSTGTASSIGQSWNPIGYVQHLRYGSDWTRNVHPDTQFVTDVANCTSDTSCSLSSVVWLQGSSTYSEHPPNTVAAGESWTQTQVNAVMNNSYLWSNSTIFITWDDFGGFADHLAPSQDSYNWTNGLRVPLLCVGRFCLQQITTTVFTPASLLKCIEDTFHVSALISTVDGAANDACFASSGMMSLSQNNPFPESATTTKLASSLNPSTFPQSVTFTTTVTANAQNGTPTGSVSFSDGSTSLGTSQLNAGVATLSTTALAAGMNSINAAYSGDSYYSPSSASLTQTVNQAATTLTLTTSTNPSTFSQPVTFSATVTPQYGGQPSGTVTFKDGSTTLSTTTLIAGVATLTTSNLAAGTHSIAAIYSGDSNFTGSSAGLSQTVQQSRTTLNLASNLNPSGLGQAVTFTATISSQYGGQATGTITFNDGSTLLGTFSVSGNAASLITSSLTIGTHSITAVYSGDSNFLGSTSGILSQVVNKATPIVTLVSSVNPSVSGKSVSFTTTVMSSAGTPTGKVEFVDSASILKTMTLSSGSAEYDTSTLPIGTNTMTAVYLGDSNNNGSISAPLNQVVLAATTTTLVSSPNPSSYGQALVFTATVTSSNGSPPNGEVVAFRQGTTVLGTGTLNSGTATFSTSTLAVGTKSIKAVYGGDANYASSTSTALSQVVTQANSTTAVTSSQNPSSYGQPVTFTATVTPQFSGTPTGTVTFEDGTTTLKTIALSGGIASYTTSTLVKGTHTISAIYDGDTNFNGSAASLTQSVQ